LNDLCLSNKLTKYRILECHKRNPGSSRNLGILSATGKWVVFCDSDDFPNFLNMINAIYESKDKYDVLIGGFEIEDLSLKLISKHPVNNDSGLAWESISRNPGLWRWLIRRPFLLNASFPEFSMGEDQCFLVKILFSKPKIKLVDLDFYRYRKGGRVSLTSSKNNVDDLVEIVELELLMVGFPAMYLRIRNYMISRQLLTLLKSSSFSKKFKVLYLLIRFIYSINSKELFFILRFNLIANKLRV
jgi:glycosyltransferase involved in cell wall biosynthesis